MEMKRTEHSIELYIEDLRPEVRCEVEKLFGFSADESAESKKLLSQVKPIVVIPDA